MALPDGRTLRVRGRIDRVDVAVDGTIHVVDYKTGSYHDGFKALAQRRPVGGGTKLQLPIYGLAGRVGAATTAGTRARRVLVRHHARAGSLAAATTSPTTCSSAPSRCSTSSCAGSTAASSRPIRPALSTFFRIACQVCDPDGLGTAELRKQWDRKRHDPALQEYADLAEPLEEPADV